MTPRLYGQNGKFSRLDLTRHSQRRLEQKETQTKHRNTTKEHRSHVRILIYRTGFQRDNLIGHFRVPKTLTSKMRPSVQPFLWKLVLWVLVRMKNDFHIKGWALNLVLKQRPRGTRKWPLCHHSGIRFIRGGPILIVCARMFNCKILSTSACCFLINDSDRWLSRTHSGHLTYLLNWSSNFHCYLFPAIVCSSRKFDHGAGKKRLIVIRPLTWL